MTLADPGYTVLLTHLSRRPTSTIPLQALRASVSHYLAHASPSPTPLSATLISSPIFLSLSYPALQVLSSALRQALHIKNKSIVDEQRGLFSRNITVQLREWGTAILHGFDGGHPVLRLACCTGLLMGINDLAEAATSWRARVEDELVVSVAEVLERYGRPVDAWEQEFVPEAPGDTMSSSLILSAQSLPLVAPPKLKVLNLTLLADLLTKTVVSAFHADSGSFLASLSSCTMVLPESQLITILPASPIRKELEDISSSSIFISIASISKLTAVVLSALADSVASNGLFSISQTLSALLSLTKDIEHHWKASPFAEITEDTSIAPMAQTTSTTIWTILKTCLFSVIMIADAVLSTVVYIPPSTVTSPSTFAMQILHTLSHLSFVLSQFGGVNSTAAPSSSFPQLKKTFYLALDVLSANAQSSKTFVNDLCNTTDSYLGDLAKSSFSLACIEQLVPILDAEQIQIIVLKVCSPFLSDPSHRETFESAHSVMLAVFASHAQRASEARSHESEGASSDPEFVERLVPFYAQCLIENSADGKLRTAQLCLAYNALVRSAGAGSYNGDALSWLCIDTLLHAMDNMATAHENPARIHRLRLALLSTISALPLPLLCRVLPAVRDVVVHAEAEARAELTDALFVEIVERVGDREKEYMMHWWDELRESLCLQLEAGGDRFPSARTPRI